MLSKQEVVELAELPPKSELKIIPIPHSSGTYAPENIEVGAKTAVVFLNEATPESLFAFSGLTMLRDQADLIFVKDKDGKLKLRTDPFPISVKGKMGSIEVLYLTLGGKMPKEKDSGGDEKFPYVWNWRDAVAKLAPVLEQMKVGKEENLAVMMGDNDLGSEAVQKIFRAMGRAFGNMRYREDFYKSKEGEVFEDGKKPKKKEGEEAPSDILVETRSALKNVFLLADMEADDPQAAVFEESFRQGDQASRMQALCRFLAECPHNILDCQTMVHVLERLFSTAQDSTDFYTDIDIYGPADDARLDHFDNEVKPLDDRRLNVLKAVHQGSVTEVGPFMVRLSYRHPSAHGKPVNVILGKGVMLDNGGQCSKGSGAVDMHADMTGAAAVANLYARCVDEKVKGNFDFVLGITSNHDGGPAFNLNDVLEFSSGKKVRILHTDAEGRLVLGDVGGAELQLLQEEEEELGNVTAVATLTGHSMLIGGNHTAVSSANRKLVRGFEDTGDELGEPHQGLVLAPIDHKGIESDGAAGDIINLGSLPKLAGIGMRGTQTAAQFIPEAMGLSERAQQRFVMVDIASTLEPPKGGVPNDVKKWPYSMEFMDTLWNEVIIRAAS